MAIQWCWGAELGTRALGDSKKRSTVTVPLKSMKNEKRSVSPLKVRCNSDFLELQHCHPCPCVMPEERGQAQREDPGKAGARPGWQPAPPPV